jgi:uncharacterized membrane protein
MVNNSLTLTHLIAVISAVLATVSYGFFSRHYEPIARSAVDRNGSKNPTTAATLLYLIAFVILFGVSVVCLLAWGWNVGWPKSIEVFGQMTSNPKVIWQVLVGMIVVMSMAYWLEVV